MLTPLFAARLAEHGINVYEIRPGIVQTDMTGLTTRFFDYHLKGTANGLDAEPPVRFLVMGENYWREEDEFPLARTRYVNWYIHSQGRANTASGAYAMVAPVGVPSAAGAKISGSTPNCGMTVTSPLKPFARSTPTAAAFPARAKRQCLKTYCSNQRNGGG